MKKRKTTLCVLLLGFGLSVQAQQTITTTGGNATGSGGSASYSVGQTIYTTNTGTNGSMAQGVQQAYEIQTVLGTANFNINLQMAVYPNPTVNYLSLNVKNHNFDNLKYQMFDLNGRLIFNEKITTETTTLSMEQYPSAVYLLKVVENNKLVKTFKIIKK